MLEVVDDNSNEKLQKIRSGKTNKANLRPFKGL
jgi:hypothetical protein